MPRNPVRDSCILFSVVLLLIVTLYVNADLFRVPIIEDGDFAANALQVQNAKSFHELLGNYSRWHFHHLGPVFFYIFGIAEYLLYDLLHVVPQPINAHIVAIILVNIAFLAGTLAIFSMHVTSKVFIPVAMATTVLFVYTVNRNNPGSALVSIWMPYVFLFCFLFFLTASASVAGGELRHLPLFTASAGMLIHAHVAQVLFVACISIFVLAVVLLRARGNIRSLFSNNSKSLAVSVAIAVVFLLPIALDACLHTPHNISAIQAYMHVHHGQQNDWKTSWKYFFSFFAHIDHPEVVLKQPRPHLTAAILGNSSVRNYWSLFSLLLLGAILVSWMRKQSIALFFKILALELIAVSLLFLFWASRISGELFTFNGFFIHSIQLLAFLIL